MKNILSLLVIVSFTIGVILGGCAPQPTASPTTTKPPATTVAPITTKPAEPSWPNTELNIGGTAIGQGSYLQSVAFAEIINKFVPKVKAAVQPTTSPTENLKLLDSKQINVAHVSHSSNYPALRGIAPFTKKVAFRMLIGGAPAVSQLVVLPSSGITKFEDIKGKKVIGDLAASPYTKPALLGLMEYYGLTEKDVTILPAASSGDALTQLASEVATAAFITGGLPQGQVLEVCTTKKAILIAPSEAAAKYAVDYSKKVGFALSVVKTPANLYPGQDKELMGVGGVAGFAVAPDFNEDLAYAIVKAIWEHQTEYEALQPAGWKGFQKELYPQCDTGPYHPGAIRLFKEKGVWTPAMEQIQNDLLAIAAK